MEMNLSARVYVYVAGTFLTATAVVWLLVPGWPISLEDLLPIALFSVFLIVAELFEVRNTTGTKQLPSTAVYVAAVILLGPIAASVMIVAGVLVGDLIIKRASPLKSLFNACSLTLSASAAGALYHAIPGSARLDSPVFLIPTAIAILAYQIINRIQAASIISLSKHESFRAVLRQHRGWHSLAPLMDVPLVAFLVFSYNYAGLWSLPLFAAPLLSAWQTSKMFEQMKESHKSTVAALTTALEADEPYTHGHSYRVAKYALQLGRRLGMSEKELETLEYGGLLHDIGKIAITNDIVCKPARLTKEEFDILASHPAIGGEIVQQMRFLEDAGKLVRHHHERPDGLGYPEGLKGDEISLGSHILNVADAIDAMTSNRPYRMALTLAQCMDEVRRFRGTQFDERVVDALETMVAEGEFELIDQADGSALRIQQILREAASMQRDVDEPAYAA